MKGLSRGGRRPRSTSGAVCARPLCALGAHSRPRPELEPFRVYGLLAGRADPIQAGGVALPGSTHLYNDPLESGPVGDGDGVYLVVRQGFQPATTIPLELRKEVTRVA